MNNLVDGITGEGRGIFDDSYPPLTYMVSALFLRLFGFSIYLILIAAGLSGLIPTNLTTVLFPGFLAEETLIFAVPGGYWIEYAGKIPEWKGDCC